MNRIIKVFLCFFFLVASIQVKGQEVVSSSSNDTTPSVLKFKGFPISGSISDMITNLQNVGYKLEQRETEDAMLSGKFMNENCEILLSATPISKQIYHIAVKFDKVDSWFSLKSDYKKKRDLVKEKYNVSPTHVKEVFEEPYYEGDGYELQAFRVGKATFGSIYDILDGSISVFIFKDCVTILYTNKSNALLKDKEERNKALDDI